MPQFISLGEVLIDFVSTEAGVTLQQSLGFHKRLGGAPANVALGVARLGESSGFLGKVGRDEFGKFLESQLKDSGVDVSQIRFTSEARTTLAFVSVTKTGERDFVFYRHPGADEFLTPRDLDRDYFRSAQIFHFGSISLTSQPSREATLEALKIARSEELVISLDPNLRLSLWKSSNEAKNTIREALAACDLVKLSEEEARWLTDETSPRRATESLLQGSPQVVLVTLGSSGCFYKTTEYEGKVRGFEVKVRDTTGAGDAFTAGFFTYLLQRKGDGNLLSLEKSELERAIRWANATGAITTTQIGATTAFPDKRQLEEFLAREE